MLLKLHIVMSFFVFCGFPLSFAQQSPDISKENVQSVSPGRYRYVFGRYDTIDDWTDVPVVQYTVDRIEGLTPLKVIIWQDGRIAWKDMSKVSKDAYFKMQLSEDEMKVFMEKMTSKYHSSPLKRRPLRANDYTGFYSGNDWSVFVDAKICSSHIFSSESWLKSLLEKSCLLSEQIQAESPQVFIDSMRKQIDKYPNKFILSYYREIYGLNKSDPASDKEIYWLIRQFAEDGEFFMFLGKTIDEMIPKDETMASTIVQRGRKRYVVNVDIDEEGNRVYSYEIVPDP